MVRNLYVWKIMPSNRKNLLFVNIIVQFLDNLFTKYATGRNINFHLKVKNVWDRYCITGPRKSKFSSLHLSWGEKLWIMSTKESQNDKTNTWRLTTVPAKGIENFNTTKWYLQNKVREVYNKPVIMCYMPKTGTIQQRETHKVWF